MAFVLGLEIENSIRIFGTPGFKRVVLSVVLEYYAELLVMFGHAGASKIVLQGEGLERGFHRVVVE